MPAHLPSRILFSLLLCLAGQAIAAETQDELPDDERVKLQALQTEIDKSERERQRRREMEQRESSDSKDLNDEMERLFKN